MNEKGFMNVDKIAQELQRDKPQASEHVVNPQAAPEDRKMPGRGPKGQFLPRDGGKKQTKKDREAEKKREIRRRYAHLRDKDGVSFDPDRHLMNKDGTPALQRDGKLKIRPGRPQRNRPFSRVWAGVDSDGTPPEEAPIITEDMQFLATGRSTAAAVFAGCQALGGADWKPSAEERALVEEAFAQQARASGLRDLPPWVTVSIALGNYAGPRLAQDKTRTKLAGWWGRMKWRAKAWYARRRGLAPEPEPAN